jgi:hypothetical protein
MIGPFFAQLSENPAYANVVFIKVDVDKCEASGRDGPPRAQAVCTPRRSLLVPPTRPVRGLRGGPDGQLAGSGPRLPRRPAGR